MTITLNGKKTNTQSTTVKQLLTEQGMTGKPVIVEVNQSAIVASAHDSTILKEGDRLELFLLGAGG